MIELKFAITEQVRQLSSFNLHARTLTNSEILSNDCFVAKYFVCMRTSEENYIPNKAIVLESVVTNTS